MAQKRKIIPRDLSWLSFNARVLQEAADLTVPLRQRIRFLGIFSNNLDEFFRVRVATLKRMVQFGNKAKMHLEVNPEQILQAIQVTVLNQQSEFNRIWDNILHELKKENIFLITEKELSPEQEAFVRVYYDEEVSPNVIPLMIESIPDFPYLRDKSFYLGVVMSMQDSALKRKTCLNSGIGSGDDFRCGAPLVCLLRLPLDIKISKNCLKEVMKQINISEIRLLKKISLC